ncbi:hypothetical protein ACUWC2_28340, partial [Klebsiella pneumoniae]|uniref:hypothetical protein n=1 Tax=Klebsiella pneumoniae TaxID=573 RepID=UPI0040559A23
TKFKIKTDHKPLLWVHGLKETSARVTKWKERLATYNFTIEHIKGKENVVADCLSRNIGHHTTAGEGSESFALRYLREWAETGSDLAPVDEAGPEGPQKPQKREMKPKLGRESRRSTRLGDISLGMYRIEKPRWFYQVPQAL